MNHIRGNFQAQIDKANKLYEAASIAELERLAQTPTPEAKQELFDKINANYFGGKSPFGEPIEIKTIDNSSMQMVWSKMNKAGKKDAGTLFGIKKVGIGSGEIMMAYLVKNIIIGGGSADVDLNLFDMKAAEKGSFKLIDKAELKEASLTTDGYLKDWRTGTKHRGVSANAVNDLRKLYISIRSTIPELDPQTIEGKDAEKMALGKGEWAKVLRGIRDLHPIEVGPKVSFELEITPDDDIIAYIQGNTIGNISDSKTMKVIKDILKRDSKPLKSFKDIEEDVAKGFGSIKGKFVFIQTSGSNNETGKGNKNIRGIFYKDNLPGNTDELKIDTVTQNTIKVKVKA